MYLENAKETFQTSYVKWEIFGYLLDFWEIFKI